LTTHERPVLQHSLPIDPKQACNESYTARLADARRVAESCRVVFNLERIRSNIESGLKGEHATHDDVHAWLEALGFDLTADGKAWVGSRRTLRHFAAGEVVQFDSM
jgi:hypothetical protein